jgi:hypothetical protein
MKLTPENKKILTTVSIVIAAYLIVIRPIFGLLGITKTAEEIAKQKQDAANIIDIEKTLANKGIKITKSKAEWDIIADTIYNDLKYSRLGDNKGDAAYQVARVKNDADILYLIKSFGSRQENFFGLPNGSAQTLPEFIRGNLNDSLISQINDNYTRKGMNFKF